MRKQVTEPMEDYFSALTDDEKTTFSAIADYVLSLGYKAKKDKTRTIGYTFTHGRVKKLILRFANNKGKPIIKIKFFAAPEYSYYFQEALRTVIEEYEYRYTGCYGCGKCNGTEGYTYRYLDGRQFYRCGTELIELLDIQNLPVSELCDLFKKQHEYYVSQINKP